MTQFTLRFYNQDQIVKEKFIRVYRTMYDGQTKNQFIDVKIPQQPYDKIGVFFNNQWGDKPIVIDNLVVEAFE